MPIYAEGDKLGVKGGTSITTLAELDPAADLPTTVAKLNEAIALLKQVFK